MLVRSLTSAARCLRRLLAGSFLLAALATPLLARAPDPRIRIPLEPLGLQHLPPQLIVAGSSLLTLHYVDDSHLLVTFAVRRLMKRLPDEAPDDFDRTVDGVLLELPSGKPIARTSWRLHDTGRYLWSLGHGRFLLRIQDRISSFAPLANLDTADPFVASPMLDTPRRIAAVLLSPDGNLLTVETAARHTGPVVDPSAPMPAPVPRRSGVLIPRTSASPDGAGRDTEPRVPFQINFFRLNFPPSAKEGVHARYAGVIGSAHPVAIPADAAGFLNVVDEGQQHYAFNFNAYSGKTEELSPFDSNCQPYPEFVSRSEFVAFGCRNGQDPQVFAGFNLRGEEMWEQVLSGSYISPTLAFSPTSDRFALSRVLTTGTVPAVGEPVEGQLSSQSVTVYQTDSGRQIFSINCTPISRSGENFALSPDGMELAVVRDAVVEVYRLPELSSKDRAGLKKAESLAPPVSDEPVRIYYPLSVTAARLAALTASQAAGQPAKRAESQVSTESPVPAAEQPPVADPGRPPAATAAAVAPAGSAPSSTNASPKPVTYGDSNEPRRKPPSLYDPPAATPQ